jgi:hypothetical protein
MKAVLFGHVVDEEQRLHEGAATVEIAPRPRAFVAVLDVLVPIEGHAVVRHLEVRLTEELLAPLAPQERERWAEQARILGERQELRLHASGPHDPLNDDRTVAFRVEDEERATVVARCPQRLGSRVEALERLARLLNLGCAEDPPAHEEAPIVERSSLGLGEDHGRTLRRALPLGQTRAFGATS